MAWELTVVHTLGIGAGLLIAGLGAFVFAARTDSWLHRAFFAFASADGLSTILFEIRDMATDESVRLWAMWFYFAAFMVFIVFLLGFGLLFPLSAGGWRKRKHFIGWLAAIVVVLLAIYLRDYSVFWEAHRTGDGIRWVYTTPGLLVLTAYVLTTAFIIARMTLHVLNVRSLSHSRQATFVLGGMVIGFAPYATTTAMDTLRQFREIWQYQGWPIHLLSLSYLVTTVTVVTAAVYLLSQPRQRVGPDRDFLLASLGTVVLLTAVSLIFPQPTVVNVILILGLIIYPTFLGYAILKFGVLDIDKRVRRVATLSLLAIALATAFLLFEEILEGILAETAFGGFGDSMATNLMAAFAAALVALPLARGVRSLIGRVAPELRGNAFDERRLEVYRHALHGALADGLVEAAELRTLQRLRETLPIGDDEHNQIAAEFARG